MKKSSEPVDTVRDKVVPAAEDLVHAVAEKIGPLADAAAEVLAQAAEKASPLAHSAVEHASPLAHSAAERLTPMVHNAAERVAPLTSQAVGFVTPYAQQAAGAVGPIASQAAAVVTPYAVLAKERGLKAGQDAAVRLAPVVGAAAASAKELSDDVLPKVGAALAAAAASPLVTEAADRGRAVVRAARGGEVPVPVPPPKKKKKSRWVSTLALIAAVGGVAYVIARKLRGDKGSQWQTARPSTPYVPPTSTGAAPGGTGDADSTGLAGAQTPDTTELYGTPGGQPAGTDTDTTAEEDVTRVLDAQADADEAGRGGEHAEGTQPVAEKKGSTEEHDTAIGGEAPVSTEDDNEAGVGPDAHPERYSGPGAYVGIEPPEGFTIKGNERSMKYHLPGASGYARTIAEVWFSSEEAAQEAGFTRAQR